MEDLRSTIKHDSHSGAINVIANAAIFKHVHKIQQHASAMVHCDVACAGAMPKVYPLLLKEKPGDRVPSDQCRSGRLPQHIQGPR